MVVAQHEGRFTTLHNALRHLALMLVYRRGVQYNTRIDPDPILVLRSCIILSLKKITRIFDYKTLRFTK